jgi:hypothetical protein
MTKAKNNKRFAATFGQDLMRGEGKIQTASLKGGLTLGTTTDPYREVDNDSAASVSGTSIFDPVLCELAYRWFSPPNGTVLDPFAGGSVRGIVASKLGRHYTGIDLSERQIIANRAQAKALCTRDDPMPRWIVGDSRNIKTLVTEPVDFIWTCPPYADLEVYSDDPRDLSQLGYSEFASIYAEIICAACERLKPNRFAGIVVGDVRGRDGCYYGFPWDTVVAFRELGGNSWQGVSWGKPTRIYSCSSRVIRRRLQKPAENSKNRLAFSFCRH